jgi:hypothetical protein
VNKKSMSGRESGLRGTNSRIPTKQNPWRHRYVEVGVQLGVHEEQGRRREAGQILFPILFLGKGERELCSRGGDMAAGLLRVITCRLNDCMTARRAGNLRRDVAAAAVTPPKATHEPDSGLTLAACEPTYATD